LPASIDSAISGRDQITGLVLAGGRGARMGGMDKGLITYRDKPLFLHVLRRLQPQVATLLISANRNTEDYRRRAPVIGDADPAAFLGPLAGILAGMHAMTTDWLAVVACDLPQLPLDAVARLAAGLDGAPAAFAAPPGRSHALVCLLHRSLAQRLGLDLAAGERRVGHWLQAIGARAVPFADAGGFINLNAGADLRAAGDP